MQLPEAPRSRPFFSAHPVFRREEYAKAMRRRSDDKVVTAMLAQHLKAGNIRRISRGVFASVPAHSDPGSWVFDRFLAASRLRPDAVIAYHSALELHGCAYTEAPDMQVLSQGASTVLQTEELSCRFVKRPPGFVAARDVVQVDRAGLPVDVTTLERTVVDCFDRHDLAGGADELLSSLGLVERLKTDEVVRQVRGLKRVSVAGALGWWLEREKDRLGVPEKALKALHGLIPLAPQYVLGAKPGDAKSIGKWNILVPRGLVAVGFEGV